MRAACVLCVGILIALVCRADETEIKKILQDEVTSWNAGDAEGYSRHFSQDGTFTNILGMFFKGRQTFHDKHQEIFRGLYKGTVLQQEIASIRFVRPDVVVVETFGSVSGFSKAEPPPGIHTDQNGCLRVRLLQVFVKNGERWEIETYHNVDLKPVAFHSEVHQ